MFTILFKNSATSYLKPSSSNLTKYLSILLGSSYLTSKYSVFHQGAGTTIYPFVPDIISSPSLFTPNPTLAVAIAFLYLTIILEYKSIPFSSL